MNGIHRLGLAAFGAIGLAALAAAATPALAGAEGGLWEVSRSGTPPVRLCLANPVALAQFEHRGARCSSQVVRQAGTATTIHYTCNGGGFGQSSLNLFTPRSLRVETQGISGNAPFKYVLQARRVGNCAGH